MLIWIKDESVADLASGSKQTILALEYLATAHREGKHIIAGNRNTLETIVASDNIDDKTKAVYNRLISNATELWNIRNKLSAYIEVIGKEINAEIDTSTDKYIIRLPITFFRDSCNIQKTLLLCENLSDAEFYRFIGTAYKHHISVERYLSIDFEALLGGGGTTASVYEQKSRAKSEESRLLLCLLDSDKSAPNSSQGSTANNVIRIHERFLKPTLRYYVINAREIENIIPFKYLEEVFALNREYLESIKSIGNIFSDPNLEEAYLFLDIKEGTFFNEIIHNVKNPLDKNFWKQISRLIPTCEMICIDNWICHKPPEKNQKKCACLVSSELSKSTLEQVVDWIENNKKDKLAREVWTKLSVKQKEEWMSLGSLIVSWCATLSRSFSS